MQTQVITYNLKERGRKYRGKERNFDIAALCSAINGPACQEKVKNRDMLGYYGHWPRIKFGMNPAEGGLDAGKPSLVEPALVTTLLRAAPDGTIEHQAEFLNNDPGNVAAKLYAARVGGFSSAIDQNAPEFFGFDYVLEPNYSTNRGYALDDISSMGEKDFEAAIYNEQLRGVLLLLDNARAERENTIAAIENLRTENEQLYRLLAKRENKKRAALDAIKSEGWDFCTAAAQKMRADAALFHAARDLPQFEAPPCAAADATPMPQVYGRMLDAILP